jgi:hypothetical protein
MKRNIDEMENKMDNKMHENKVDIQNPGRNCKITFLP